MVYLQIEVLGIVMIWYQHWWSNATLIMMHQRKQWIHFGHGVISSFDELCSELSCITDWLRSPQRGATFEYISFEDTIKRVQLRSFPCIALRIPTAHNFSTHIKKMAAFSLWLWFVDTINRNGSDPGRLALVSFLILLSTAVYYSLRLACYFPPVSLVFPTISLRLAQKALWLAYSVSSYKIVRVTLYSFKIFGFQQPARW